MRNWSEYTWLVNHMVETGFIKTIREIWWDVRPHHSFGTVEVRICDMPPSLEDVLGLTALIQCLVYDLSEEIDRGTYQFDCHPFLIRQNKWRACRYGMDAKLVDPATLQAVEARRLVTILVDRLRPRAEELGCGAISTSSATSPPDQRAQSDSSRSSKRQTTWLKSYAGCSPSANGPADWHRRREPQPGMFGVQGSGNRSGTVCVPFARVLLSIFASFDGLQGFSFCRKQLTAQRLGSTIVYMGA